MSPGFRQCQTPQQKISTSPLLLSVCCSESFSITGWVYSRALNNRTSLLTYREPESRGEGVFCHFNLLSLFLPFQILILQSTICSSLWTICQKIRVQIMQCKIWIVLHKLYFSQTLMTDVHYVHPPHPLCCRPNHHKIQTNLGFSLSPAHSACSSECRQPEGESGVNATQMSGGCWICMDVGQCVSAAAVGPVRQSSSLAVTETDVRVLQGAAVSFSPSTCSTAEEPRRRARRSLPCW